MSLKQRLQQLGFSVVSARAASEHGNKIQMILPSWTEIKRAFAEDRELSIVCPSFEIGDYSFEVNSFGRAGANSVSLDYMHHQDDTEILAMFRFKKHGEDGVQLESITVSICGHSDDPIKKKYEPQPQLNNYVDIAKLCEMINSALHGSRATARAAGEHDNDPMLQDVESYPVSFTAHGIKFNRERSEEHFAEYHGFWKQKLMFIVLNEHPSRNIEIQVGLDQDGNEDIYAETASLSRQTQFSDAIRRITNAIEARIEVFEDDGL